MNLLRTVIMVTRDPEKAKATDEALTDLRATARASSYTWFKDMDWLDRDMIVALITLLERWSEGGNVPLLSSRHPKPRRTGPV